MKNNEIQIAFYGFFKLAILPQLIGFAFLIIEKLI
jgi:hypothetical protein